MDSPSHDQLMRLIARDLPGWTLAPPKERAGRSTNPNIRPGPTLEALAKKAGLPAPRAHWLSKAINVESFRVMPENGGEAKVAELCNGRVRIVQG